MKLEIINDIELDISFEITIGNQKYLYKNSNKSEFYELSSQDEVTVRMFKENIWKQTGKLNYFFLKLYSLDLIFGNLAESENMPFSIDSQITVSNSEPVLNQKILLSDIVQVDNNCLFRWRKNSRLQNVTVSLMIVIIGVILSFIFESWIKLFFLIGISILTGGVWILLNNKMKKLFNILKSFT